MNSNRVLPKQVKKKNAKRRRVKRSIQTNAISLMEIANVAKVKIKKLVSIYVAIK